MAKDKPWSTTESFREWLSKALGSFNWQVRSDGRDATEQLRTALVLTDLPPRPELTADEKMIACGADEA